MVGLGPWLARNRAKSRTAVYWYKRAKTYNRKLTTENPHQIFFFFFFAAMQELLADSLLSWLMIYNQFGVGQAGLWVERGLAGKICFHIWLPLNELEPDASTHSSDPSQHMGKLVSPVWSNYIQNSLTCNKSRKLPFLCFHIWLPLTLLKPDANTHFSNPLQHMGKLLSPVLSNYI